jgi:hypothetical protein
VYDYQNGWIWEAIVQGTYPEKLCDGCEQVVWEYEAIDQALIYLDQLEYYMSHLTFCLPCFKAFRAMPQTCIDYTPYLVYDMSEVPLPDVVWEYWLRKATLNYTPEEVRGIKNGTLTALDIIARRIRLDSQQ